MAATAEQRLAEMRKDLLASYTRRADELDLNDQEFRVSARRGGVGTISLDGLVEQVEWTDGTSDTTGDVNDWIALTGSITLRKPDDEQRSADISLGEGDVITLKVMWFGTWQEVWRMRVARPEGTTLTDDGSWSFNLIDDAALLAASEDDFRYRKGKGHPRGWFYHQIVRDVCRRYRIPVGKVVRGRKRITKLEQLNSSPLDVIADAVREERKWTGRRYLIRWEDGKLNVIPYSPQRVLYTLGEQITSYEVNTRRREDLATAITARATVKKKGGGSKKLEELVLAPVKARQRYGFIHKEVTFKGVDSEHELVSKAKRSLARRLKPIKTLSVSHPGIAFLRRGDAVRVSIPEEGYKGPKGVAFCQSVSHRVAAGDYTMDLTLTFEHPNDPIAVQREKDKAARRRKAAAKKRKGT